jgi:DnaK suppressor protein
MSDVLLTSSGPRTSPDAGADSVAALPELRAELESLRVFRLQQLEDLDAELQTIDGGVSSQQLRTVLTSLKVAALVALREIDGALERITTDGGYGLCQSCEAQIPLERLRVLPMAALCMCCQAASESSRGRP